jgi:hypothetical protein
MIYNRSYNQNVPQKHYYCQMIPLNITEFDAKPANITVKYHGIERQASKYHGNCRGK